MRRVSQPYQIVQKFYPMYGLRQPKDPADTDIYDDPAEFYIPEVRSPTAQQTSNSAVYSTESLYPSYENIDDFAKQLRLSGLTDSGHYSNRSSDVSLSLPAGTQHNMETQMASNQGADGTQRTYERPNRNLAHTFPKQYKHQLDSHLTMSTSTQNSYSPPSKPPGMTSKPREVKTLQLSTRHSLEHQKNKLKSMIARVSSDTDDLSIHSESTSHSSCSFIWGDLPSHFQTKLEFVRFWDPIFERLKNESQSLIQLFGQDSKSDSTPPTGLPIITHCEFDQDLLIINQLCTFMIAISKRNPDAGLTRKFVLHRQTLENLGEKFESYWKAFQQSDSSNSVDSKFSVQDVEKLFRSLQSELDILGTTILANFSLLFPNSSGKQQEDYSPLSQPSLSDLSVKSSTLEHAQKTPQPQLDLEQHDSNSPPTITDEKNLKSDFGIHQNDPFPNHLKPSDPESLRSQFYRLLSLCDLASDDVQAYLAILLNPSHTDLTSKPSSLTAGLAAATTPTPSLSFSSSSSACTTATATTTPTTTTTNHNNNTNINNSSIILTSHFMILQTKQILSNSSRLVQLITELCSLLIVREKHQTNQNDAHVKQLIDLRYNLENCGDKICESLKGLITQTKESTRHINASQTAKLESGSSMPVPGPLLQRLIGAVRSVGFSLDKIKLTLNQFLENCKL